MPNFTIFTKQESVALLPANPTSPRYKNHLNIVKKLIYRLFDFCFVVLGDKAGSDSLL
jgi:hypothetical protein